MATHSIPPRGIEINQRTPEVDEVAIRAHLGLAPSFDPYQLDGSEEVERECGGFTVWTITKAGAPYFFRPQCSWRTGCDRCDEDRAAAYRLKVTSPVEPDAPLFGEHPAIFYLPTDAALSERFKKRRLRAKCDWLYVPTRAGLHHYFSSADLAQPGDPLPSVTLSPEEARSVLCAVLQPGLVCHQPGARRGSSWSFTDDAPKGGGSALGPCDPRIADQVWGLLGERTETLFGTAVTRTSLLPPSLDTHAHRRMLRALFQRCVTAVRAGDAVPEIT